MKIYYPLFFLFFFIYCSHDNDSSDDTLQKGEDPETIDEVFINDYLTESTSYLSFSGGLLTSFSTLTTGEILPYEFRDVKSVKIIYKTVDTENNPITASGVIILPEEPGNYELVSVQHGTINSDENAPSHSALGFNEFTLGAIIAGTGFISILPDYIGYGASNSIRHPYEHQKSLAQSVSDMILASKEYLRQEDIEYSNTISLVGYSEGGFATLSAFKKLETESIIPINKVISGAGAYNKTRFAKSLLASDEELPFIGHYLWVLDVYNSLYPNLNRPWSAYLNEPYATQITNYGEINTTLPNSIFDTTNPKNLFLSSFLSGIVEETDTPFLDALIDNDVHDWTPKAPIHLFHGTKDELILPFISESTAETLNANGGTVIYTPIEDKDHRGAIIPFFVNSLSILNQ